MYRLSAQRNATKRELGFSKKKQECWNGQMWSQARLQWARGCEIPFSVATTLHCFMTREAIFVLTAFQTYRTCLNSPAPAFLLLNTWGIWKIKFFVLLPPHISSCLSWDGWFLQLTGRLGLEVGSIAWVWTGWEKEMSQLQQDLVWVRAWRPTSKSPQTRINCPRGMCFWDACWSSWSFKAKCTPSVRLKDHWHFQPRRPPGWRILHLSVLAGVSNLLGMFDTHLPSRVNYRSAMG